MEKVYGKIEYKMSRQMANWYLKARKGDELKMRPNDYLCRVVDEQFGLMGKCERVIVE
jgi:hypothetical protein